MQTGRELIDFVAQNLAEQLYNDLQPRLYEARIIAEHITGDSYGILLQSHYELNDFQQHRLENVLVERNRGKPLAYVLKSAPFRDLELYVDERVLIPRMETEILVDYALKEIARFDIDNINVVDIGTGSGAIAISIVHETENVRIWATDISSDALQVVQLNMTGLGSAATKIELRCGDLLDALEDELHEKVNIIVSNPPYIGEDERGEVEKSVLEYEPQNALFAGAKGEDIYRKIIGSSQKWLAPKGSILFEISPRHCELMYELARTYEFVECEIYKDLTGRDRICIMRTT